MKEFIAFPRKSRLLSGFILASIYFVLSLWMVGAFGDAPTIKRIPEIKVHFFGYVGLIFYPVAILYIVRSLYRAKFSLWISPIGIISSDWSDKLIPWSNIEDIGERNTSGVKMITICLKDSRSIINNPFYIMLSSFYRKFYGFDISFNLLHTDRLHEEALEAINFFRPLKGPGGT